MKGQLWEATGEEAMPPPEGKKQQLHDDVDLVQAACYVVDELATPDREWVVELCARVSDGELLSPDDRDRLRALIGSA